MAAATMVNGIQSDVLSRNDALIREALADIWLIKVYDDDVTTFATVIRALRVVIGLEGKVAVRKTFEVHNTGSAVVWYGDETEARDKTKILTTQYKIRAQAHLS